MKTLKKNEKKKYLFRAIKHEHFVLLVSLIINSVN